jgi:hypothetical protein
LVGGGGGVVGVGGFGSGVGGWAAASACGVGVGSQSWGQRLGFFCSTSSHTPSPQGLLAAGFFGGVGVGGLVGDGGGCIDVASGSAGASGPAAGPQAEIANPARARISTRQVKDLDFMITSHS